MAVQLSDLRTLIPDKPFMVPSPQPNPESMGRGDGTTTQFYLLRAGLVPGTLIMYSSTDSQTWTQISSGWTIDTSNRIITFTAAPATSTYIGARYQVTWFTDSELTLFLNNALTKGYLTDYQTGLHCKLQALGVLMTDPERMQTKHFGDRFDDTTAWIRGIEAQIKQINSELSGALSPNKNAPSVVMVDGGYAPYVPIR